MNLSNKLLIFCLILFSNNYSKEKIEVSQGLTSKEIEYIQNAKEDIVYINNDTRRVVKNLCNKKIIKDTKNYLSEFCKACQSDWKVVPSRVAHYAMEELKKVVENNKGELKEKKYDRVSAVLKNYETNLQNKQAQFFFSTDKAAATNATFNNLVVIDTLTVRNLLQVNNQSGGIGVRIGNDNGTERLLSRLPVSINFTPTASTPNSFVVVGTATMDSLTINNNQAINGSLNVNGNITIQNSPVVVSASNVGSGTGLVFRDKTGNTLNLKSLVAGNNITFDTSNNNQITISATSSGNVSGPVSSTDNAVARYDGTTGKVIQNSGVTIDDSNNVVTSGQITASQFNGNLNGTVTNAANFTNPLQGNVTGPQNATVVQAVPGSATINGQLAFNTVINPGASTDNGIARFDSTSGKVIQNSGAIVDDTGSIIAVGTVSGSQVTAGGSTVLTNAQNVGAGTGLIFRDKTVNTANLRSLVAGTNVTFDTSNNDQITISATGSGMGDVTGPVSSTDNAITRFDGTTGKLIQNSAATLDDSGNVTTTGTVDATQLTVSSSPVLTTAQNVGSGTGLIFRDKTGNTANLRSLVAGTNVTFDTSNNDQVTISATGGGGSGDVTGPASSTDNALTRFDGTTGKLIQNSAATLDDSGNITTTGTVDATQLTVSSSPVLTTAQNVGAGTGLIFRDKTGNTANLRSLVAGTNVTFDTSNNDQVTISATGGGGSGDVTGPASSTDNAITRFDGTTGKLIQDSTVTLDDSGNITTSGTVASTQSTVGGSAVVTTAQNVGAGTGTIFRDKTGNTLNLKSLVAGTNITLNTSNPDQITIAASGATGNVVGPASATDNAITRFDTTTGKLIQNSIATLDDSGNITTTGTVGGAQVNANGSTVITTLQNVGAGTGLIFQSKASNTANLRSLVAGTNVTFDTSNDNQITISSTGSGSGDVAGPASATDNALARFDGTTGKLIQNSLVTSDDTGNVTTPGTVNLTGNLNLTTSPSSTTAGSITQASSIFVHNKNSTTNFFGGLNAATVITTGTNNCGVGNGALGGITTGSNNTAVGQNALAANATTDGNTAVGQNALRNNTTGTNNAALGASALNANITGSNNTAIGANALLVNTASNNTAIGQSALTSNTSGTANTAVGASALGANTTTSNNTAVGNLALQVNVASSNTAVGFSALKANTTGTNNTAVGSLALSTVVSTSNNTAVGTRALLISTGASNTAVGNNSLQANTTGGNNVAVGASSLAANTTASNNIAIGAGALAVVTTNGSNVAVGNSALAVNTGTSNTAVGNGCMVVNTSGSNNTAVGNASLDANTTANFNVAIGDSALGANTNGTSNTAVGRNALSTNIVGTENTAVGTNALTANTVSTNTAVGALALAANTTGTNNSALGRRTLLVNTTGTANTAIGSNSLGANISGNNNTALGSSALLASTSTGNTAIGMNALTALTSGASNIALGASAGSTYTTESSNIAIGHTGTAADAGVIRIGTSPTQASCFIAGINGVAVTGNPVLVSSTGQLGTATSSIRYKKDIQDLSDERNKILDLRPVSFKYKSDAQNNIQYGLIAEEVEKVSPELVIYKDNKPESVKYQHLPILLLAKLQKMQKEIDEHNIEIFEQKQKNEMLENKINKLIKKAF